MKKLFTLSAMAGLLLFNGIVFASSSCTFNLKNDSGSTVALSNLKHIHADKSAIDHGETVKMTITNPESNTTTDSIKIQSAKDSKISCELKAQVWFDADDGVHLKFSSNECHSLKLEMPSGVTRCVDHHSTVTVKNN